MASDLTAANTLQRTQEAASAVVELHLPEERLRIGDLLKGLSAPAGNQSAEVAGWLGLSVAAECRREDRHLCHLPRHGRSDCT